MALVLHPKSGDVVLNQKLIRCRTYARQLSWDKREFWTQGKCSLCGRLRILLPALWSGMQCWGIGFWLPGWKNFAGLYQMPLWLW